MTKRIPKPYGMELIIDLEHCNIKKFNRASITEYFEKLCELIKMQRCDLHFWDDLYSTEEEKQFSPHTIGTSAVQFILTSNITIHTLDQLEEVYVNIFSCKEFDPGLAARFTWKYFEGKLMYQSPTVIIRGQRR